MRRLAPAWAVSFADLGLLLLGCFVMLHAMEANRPEASASPAATLPPPRPSDRLRAAELFEYGEARLRPGAADRLRGVARRLPAGQVDIVSRGAGEGGSRLDRFELAAARAAAVSRALRDAGIAEDQLTLRLQDAAGAAAGQQIEIHSR